MPSFIIRVAVLGVVWTTPLDASTRRAGANEQLIEVAPIRALEGQLGFRAEKNIAKETYVGFAVDRWNAPGARADFIDGGTSLGVELDWYPFSKSRTAEKGLFMTGGMGYEHSVYGSQQERSSVTAVRYDAESGMESWSTVYDEVFAYQSIGYRVGIGNLFTFSMRLASDELVARSEKVEAGHMTPSKSENAGRDPVRRRILFHAGIAF